MTPRTAKRIVSLVKLITLLTTLFFWDGPIYLLGKLFKYLITPITGIGWKKNNDDLTDITFGYILSSGTALIVATCDYLGVYTPNYSPARFEWKYVLIPSMIIIVFRLIYIGIYFLFKGVNLTAKKVNSTYHEIKVLAALPDNYDPRGTLAVTEEKTGNLTLSDKQQDPYLSLPCLYDYQ